MLWTPYLKLNVMVTSYWRPNACHCFYPGAVTDVGVGFHLQHPGLVPVVVSAYTDQEPSHDPEWAMMVMFPAISSVIDVPTKWLDAQSGPGPVV